MQRSMASSNPEGVNPLLSRQDQEHELVGPTEQSAVVAFRLAAADMRLVPGWPPILAPVQIEGPAADQRQWVIRATYPAEPFHCLCSL